MEAQNCSWNFFLFFPFYLTKLLWKTSGINVLVFHDIFFCLSFKWEYCISRVFIIIIIFFHIHLDKRNSTGNLYFSDSNTNQPDHPLSSLSNTLQQGSARILRGLSGSQPVGMRDSTSSLSSMNSDYDPNDPQAMVSRELRTAAGLNFTFFYTYEI